MNITAKGHENVTGKHEKTIEITKEPTLTKQGDCIIGVSATKACVDLPISLKQKIQTGAKIKVTLKCGLVTDTVTGYGDPELSLTHTKDIVLRKSIFKCSRTLMIKADKACSDLKPELIKKLQKPSSKLNFRIEVF